MDETQKAFLDWTRLMPSDFSVSGWQGIKLNRYGEEVFMKVNASLDGNCCMSMHYTTDREGRFIQLPDERVCAREKAWRKYVSLRDMEHEKL